jgi:hypothetical protein
METPNSPDSGGVTRFAERCASCGGWISWRCTVCRGEPIEGVDIRTCARGVGQVDRVCRRWTAKQDDEEREAA